MGNSYHYSTWDNDFKQIWGFMAAVFIFIDKDWQNKGSMMVQIEHETTK